MALVTQHSVIEFNTRMELLLQEADKLSGTCEVGQHTGKQATFLNQFGSLEVQDPAGRFADLNYVSSALARRWVFPQDKELAELVDSFDVLRILEDPKGKLAESQAKAFARFKTSLIINAANATAYVGESGTTTEPWDTAYEVANSVGGSGATGMNVKKLNTALRMFEENKVDVESEKPTLVIGPKQNEELRDQAQVTSSDFNGGRPSLVSGRVPEFMGFNIKVTTLLNKTGSDRACLVYVPSGIHFGVWQDVMTDVTQLKHKSSLPWQIYSKMTAGATRTQLGKVLVVQCTES